MFEQTEKPSELFKEIRKGGAGWRAEHLDLPVTLLFLSRIKRALPWLSKSDSDHEAWSRLKADGKSLARRRALFVAAEAVGHLRRGALAGERETIRKALGVVVEEGATLDKVRALRALSFIPSNECVPILKRGMQDRSAWVQATALNILFSMNLRESAPRAVMTDFLRERFEQQARREEVFNPRAVVTNFHVNRGLLVALLKVPGGKLLALLSLWLWIESLLRGLLLVLRAGAGAFFKGLGIAAVCVFNVLAFLASALFVKLPRLLLTPTERPPETYVSASYTRRKVVPAPAPPPDLARATLIFFYAVFIRLPYQLLAVPLSARHVERSFGALRGRGVYLALLDYLFAGLLVVALLPGWWVWLTLAAGFYWLLVAASGDIENEDRAERFRLFNRCAGAALLAVYARASGLDERLTVALWVLAAVQVVWLLPLFARAFVVFVKGFVFVLVYVCKGAARLITTFARDAVKALREKAPPRERLLAEAVSLIGRGLRTFGRNLRPHLKRIAVRVLGLCLFLGAVYYGMRSLNLRPSDVSKLTGPELGALLVSLKPVLYFAVGVTLVALPCWVLLRVFRLLWDELWIVERVTFRTRSRNFKRFRNDNDFLAYVFQLVRDQRLATGFRVRAAAALKQVPLASRQYVDQLADLAEEEGLPPAVSDAVSKVADEAEKRLTRRAQDSEFKVDMDLVNRQLGNLWQPGEVLRPRIRKALAAVLLPPVGALAALLYAGGGGGVSYTAALWCLGLGCALVLLYAFTAARQSKYVKWSLLYGLILLVSVFARPLQVALFEPRWDDFFQNGLVAVVELSTFTALIVPALLAGLVAQVGHTVYLLGSDAEFDLELEGKPHPFERRLKRYKRQANIVGPAAVCAVCAGLALSAPLQEYFERRGERLPSFAANGKESEVELRDFPADGRLVRVALLKADKQAEPPAPRDGRPLTAEEARDAVTRSLTDGGIIPLDAETVWGDVWLTMQDGKVIWGVSSPIRCLEPAAMSGNVVTFNLHALCSYDVKVRLVAVVYDKKRSDFLMHMRLREGVQVDDVNTANPTDSLLLLDTVSPFVKAVWSPVF